MIRSLLKIAPVVAILAVAFLGLVGCSSSQPSDAGGPSGPTPKPSVVVSSDGTQHITLVVKTDVQHGRLGMDGQWHDAFLPASFTTQVGVPVTVTVLNYDSGWHSFTAPSIGLDVRVKGGGTNHPATTVFTFTPTASGVIPWFCKAPCDPWAMGRLGYMVGTVQVLPAA